MATLAHLLKRAIFRLWNPPGFQSPFFLIESLHLARAYYVAAELGIADLVQERPRSCAELAQLTATDQTWLYRFLRTLAAFRIFAEDKQGLFHLTRRARVLLTDAPESLRSWFILMGSGEVFQGFAKTLEAVKNGGEPFHLAHGMSFYDYLAQSPQLAEAFRSSMDRWTEWHTREIVRAYDFGRFKTLVDVGGGLGSLVQHIVTVYPQVRGILYDRPQAIDMARARFEAAGLSERCDLVSGNFLEEVPADADAYVLKHVLRDWNDDCACQILMNCHRAMRADGRLLVIDAAVDPRNGTDRMVKLLDLQIGSLTSGRFRTRAELEALFNRSGFELVEIHLTGVPDSLIIEAKKSP